MTHNQPELEPEWLTISGQVVDNKVDKPNNTPNKNIVIIDNILGWSSEIDKGLETLRIEAKTTDQKYAVSEAVEQIEIFQRVDVNRLRKAFE